MAMHAALVFSLLVLLCSPLAVVDAAMGCGTVVTKVSPCIPFARSGGSPSTACCSGISSLNQMASSGTDRRVACSCLKTFVRTIRGVNLNYVSSLPAKCNVHVPYPIAYSTDCSRVN